MFIFHSIRYLNPFGFFWLTKEPSIKYDRNSWGDGGTAHYKYVRTYTISFHVFGSIFVF